MDATPQRRAQLVDGIRTIAVPATVRLLAEALIGELRKKRADAAAVAVLVALGSGVLPTLESAVRNNPSEVLLLRLAPVIVALGRQLPQRERASLQLHIGIAAGRAPNMECRVLLDTVMWDLREQKVEEHDAETRKAGQYGAELLARYGL